MSPFPRDLLRGLPPLHQFSQRPEEKFGETEEGIELNLGLSLNGRFGVDPRIAKRDLSRTSSIPEFLNPSKAEMEFSSSPLFRTCSMPAEAEEECRKRKEIQSLRRLEAKRKRSQKQGSCSIRDRAHGEDHSCNSVEEGLDQIHLQPGALSKQGSVGSQGSGTGSSGISSEYSQQPIQVAESEPKSSVVPGLTRANSSIPANRCGLPPKGGPGTAMNVLEEMPFVFTKGDGPEGKRVEGFLYRYRKGEEVRIVCVCHGSFLSPAEFVKHAGGGDMAHPMRHIVVLPSSLL